MTLKRLLYLFVIVVLGFTLGACAETAENEHLPEYCQTYSGFMATASLDLYTSEELGDINRFNYLSVIAEIDLTFEAPDPYDEFDLDGSQCFQNLTSLT